MRTDIYTKCILTIIAIALLWQCVQNATSPKVVLAQQQPGESRVIISGYLNSDNGLVNRFNASGVPVAVVSPLEGQLGNAAIRIRAQPK